MKNKKKTKTKIQLIIRRMRLAIGSFALITLVKIQQPATIKYVGFFLRVVIYFCLFFFAQAVLIFTSDLILDCFTVGSIPLVAINTNIKCSTSYTNKDKIR
jgi:hypothetical protein